MARMSDGASVPTSSAPASSFNFGSSQSSCSDLNGTGTRLGITTDEKLDALLSQFVQFKEQIAQIPTLTNWMSRMDSHITRTLGGFCDQTYRDGTEFQHPVCSLSIKCIWFGTILAFS